MKTLLTAVLFGGFLLSSASAESWRNDRFDNQRRIWAGSYNGRLTPREAAQLRWKQEQIDRQYRRDRWDGGGLSYAERRELARRQERLNRQTYRDLHDRDRRW